MNKRLKELMNQSMIKVWGHGAFGESESYQDLDPEKFAELIVRECAEFLENNSGYDDANNAWHPEPEDLLKHFGVI
jgi:hypothetical protein